MIEQANYFAVYSMCHTVTQHKCCNSTGQIKAAEHITGTL